MAYQLNTFVHVVERDGKGEVVRTGQFGPGEDLPAWAAKAITNPDVWDGPAPAHAQRDDTTPASALAGSGDAATVPPRSGTGSGKEAWSAYAQAKGVDVPDGATREEIIAALEEAGVPVTQPEE